MFGKATSPFLREGELSSRQIVPYLNVVTTKESLMDLILLVVVLVLLFGGGGYWAAIAVIGGLRRDRGKWPL
jgi:hypothetical protein